MTINLEILEASFIYNKVEIEELDTKQLVPKMMTRRRLTRASKIAIYLASKVHFTKGRILYGSSFGELPATANILNAIDKKESISPTHFQNSVYNTAVSYLSILSGNKEEIQTISSGENTSLNVLKAGAVKALDGDTVLLMATETLNIEHIEEVNTCSSVLEAGVALKVRVTDESATDSIISELSRKNIPASLHHMFFIAEKFSDSKMIVEVIL